MSSTMPAGSAAPRRAGLAGQRAAGRTRARAGGARARRPMQILTPPRGHAAPAPQQKPLKRRTRRNFEGDARTGCHRSLADRGQVELQPLVRVLKLKHPPAPLDRRLIDRHLGILDLSNIGASVSGIKAVRFEGRTDRKATPLLPPPLPQRCGWTSTPWQRGLRAATLCNQIPSKTAQSLATLCNLHLQTA